MEITRISTDSITREPPAFNSMARKETLEQIRCMLTSNLDTWKSYLDPEIIESSDADFMTGNDITWEYADEDIGTQYLDLTVATDDTWSAFGYQTGDNSFTGAVYWFPHWAVTSIGHETTVDDLMDDITEQLDELIAGMA